jgi:hypothetical protein
MVKSVSAVWNAAFDTGTGIGAVAVDTLAATGMGVPVALGVCAGLIAVFLPLAAMSSTGMLTPEVNGLTRTPDVLSAPQGVTDHMRFIYAVLSLVFRSSG